VQFLRSVINENCKEQEHRLLIKLVKLYFRVLIYASLVFYVLFPDQRRAFYHSVCAMIAAIERKVKGHIGRPMCVFSQGTLQTFMDFYVGHFPIELSRKIRFDLCIA